MVHNPMIVPFTRPGNPIMVLIFLGILWKITMLLMGKSTNFLWPCSSSQTVNVYQRVIPIFTLLSLYPNIMVHNPMIVPFTRPGNPIMVLIFLGILWKITMLLMGKSTNFLWPCSSSQTVNVYQRVIPIFTSSSQCYGS